ncbi:ABC transporter permease, partial [Lactobacillus equicursoris]
GQDVTAAEAKLQAAQKELNRQKKEITSLPQGTYSLYTRSTWPGGDGYSSYKNEVNAVKAVANVFPIIFYLVAALVVFTTRTRFVDEERQNSGLLRALGYSKKTVMGKFVIYGLVTSILGSAIGVILGNYLIAPVVNKICVRGMIIQKVVLGVYPGYLVLILLAALLAAVWPSFWVARRDLKDVPASLLLPKPPAAGSKILLEKITFVWNYLSFQGKVTARNIFRYKQRMLMTIFGVAGSVALLFTGLGIRSAISGIVNRQYQEIFSYDLLAVEKTGFSSKAKKKLEQKVNQLGQSEWIYYETSDNFVKGSSESQTISLIVPQKALKLINLDNRKSGKKIALPKTGAVISEKLAKLAGVKVGDMLSVNLAGQKRQVKVRAICEMYAGHYLFMSKTAFEKATGKKYETNSALVKLKGAKIAASSKALLKLSATQAVIQNQAMITNLKQTVNSLQTVMIILLILSIQLAVVILYNLTNINVSERVRELSTIKVLGLHNHEVTNYIYRETAVLSIIGIFAGLLLGRIMDLKILEMMAADAVMFDPAAPWFVYLAPFAEIIIILGILWMVVDKKLSKIDMLGALKAVD